MTADVCRVSTGQEAGHDAVYIENDLLKITVLPGKGADIYQFIHKPTGLDILWKNPVGLWPPGSPPHDGSGEFEFLQNYEGSWQELFPSCNDPTTYAGVELPFHGEVAHLPWAFQIEAESDDRVSVRFSVETRKTAFRLERVMRLDLGSSRLTLDETIVNVGTTGQHFVWGQHCVVGGPWLEAGCRLESGARTITTIEKIYEEKTARLAPGQREPWPFGKTRDGGTVDLSVIPGPEAHSHDDVYLTDLDGGWASVSNPRIGLAFRMRWDPGVFRWIISWQPYGGAEAAPFKSMPYAVGVEPWISNLPLGEAVKADDAHFLVPGESFSTTLTAEITYTGGT